MGKICTKCNEQKPYTQFYKEKANKDGHQRYCKNCSKQTNSKWYKAVNNNVPTVLVKTCSCCREQKSAILFYKQKNTKDGLQNMCKQCSTNYKKTNLDRVRRLAKIRYSNRSEEEKDRHSIRKKAWTQNNLEKCREASKRWRHLNKEKCYESNKKSKRRQYHNNLTVRIKMSLRTRLYQALKGMTKHESATKLLGCAIEEFKHYIQQMFTEGMSWENHGEWHLDHIKPCASFNLLDENERKICFHYTNFQPLWAMENILKSDNLDWVRTS